MGLGLTFLWALLSLTAKLTRSLWTQYCLSIRQQDFPVLTVHSVFVCMSLNKVVRPRICARLAEFFKVTVCISPLHVIRFQTEVSWILFSYGNLCRTNSYDGHSSVVSIGFQSAVHLSFQYVSMFVYTGGSCERILIQIGESLNLTSVNDMELSCWGKHCC